MSALGEEYMAWHKGTRRALYFKRTCQCTRVREEGCRGIDMVRHKGDGTRRASDLEENLL